MTEIEDRPLVSEPEPVISCEHCFAAIYGQAIGAGLACAGCRRRVMARYSDRNRPREPKPEVVDFGFVPEHQASMHARLENWGRACNGGWSAECAAGFGQHQSGNTWEGTNYCSDIKVPVDRPDSTVIARGIYMLPTPHMKALQWSYVQRTSVMDGRRSLGCTNEALARYVIDARQMLINRGV